MDTLQKLTQQLQQQQQLLRTYQAHKQGASSKMYRFEKRVKELKAIKGDIDRRLDNCADDVRSEQGKACGALRDGVNGNGRIDEIAQQLQQGCEKSSRDDDCCSQMICEIDSEINRCNAEQDNASSELGRADANISTTRSNITKLQRRIREEQAKKKSRK